MLRTDQELALDDVTEASKYAADQFEKLAELSKDSALSELIGNLEETHRRHVSKLEELIRRMGNLPSAPDPDREALSRLGMRVKAAFAQDREGELAECCREIESRVIETVREAREKNLTDELRTLVADIGEDCVRMCRRLEDYL